MSQGLCRGSAVGRTVSLVLSWEAVYSAFMLYVTSSPPRQHETFLSANEAEAGVNQLYGLKCASEGLQGNLPSLPIQHSASLLTSIKVKLGCRVCPSSPGEFHRKEHSKWNFHSGWLSRPEKNSLTSLEKKKITSLHLKVKPHSN